MSVMDRDRWSKLEPLLDTALELSPDDRTEWLADLSTTAPDDVVAELRQLLAADAAAGRRSFLERPVELTLAGVRVGAYTLERPLGDGGMGSVWLARRTDGRFDGVAAVKLLDLALLTEAGQARFRREGSALARLTHPGIAHLLDAGVTAAGQSYLVLEYVDGQPIDAFVTERALSRVERVRLFLDVLDAVGHAHARLIVHRDLKPSNIFVTRAGTVKLLDFGIAKLLDEEDGGAPSATTRERAVPLTPHFAAPEQLRGEAVTTATDIYALGVLLYVLLSGRHPTAEGCDTPAAVMEALLERDPAPLGVGDLDAVLAKALQRCPAKRYQSAAAFGDDLLRWIRFEPVSARADAPGYRIQKFLRRHRRGVLAAGAGVALLVGWIAMVIRDREQVRTALAEATTNARRAEQVSEFTVALFENAGPRPVYADSMSADELLARAAANAQELSAQPAIEAQMLDLVGRIRTALGDYAGARPVLAEALTVRRRALGPAHPDVATSLMHMAAALDGQERHTRALPLLHEALALRQQLFGEADPRTTDALYALATQMHMAGDYRGARPLFERWTSLVLGQPPQITPARAEQLHSLASIYAFSGQLPRAESLARQSVALTRALYGERHDRVANVLSRLGGILTDRHADAAADSAHRAAIAILRANHPDGHVDIANALRNYGYLLVNQRRWDEAARVWSECAAGYRRFEGEDGLGFANAVSYLGHVQSASGHPVDGEHTLRGALSLPALRRPAARPVLVRTRLFLGDALREQGRLVEAEPLLVEGYRLTTGAGLARATHDLARGSLVRLYEAQGRAAEAATYR